MPSGRIVRISAPDGAKIVSAADLDGVRPIRPMLHKFNYQPIEQPILAKDVVRFVGEPIAAVCAPTPPKPRTSPISVEIEIDELPAVVDARDALAPDAPRVHDDAPTMSWSKADIKTADFDATLGKAHRRIRLEVRSHRQNATPLEARAAHAAFDPATGRITLTCTTQMPHLTRTAIADVLGFAGIRSARDRARRRRRFRPENVARRRIRRAGLAGAASCETSVAWSEDRRENLIAAFHSRDQHIELEGALRRRRQADRARRPT